MQLVQDESHGLQLVPSKKSPTKQSKHLLELQLEHPEGQQKLDAREKGALHLEQMSFAVHLSHRESQARHLD